MAGVSVFSSNSPSVLLTTTDGSGSYSLTGQQIGDQGSGTLDFQRTGYYVNQAAFTVTAAPTTVNGSLLPGGPVLQGTVKDANTQAGIVGAEVVLGVVVELFSSKGMIRRRPRVGLMYSTAP